MPKPKLRAEDQEDDAPESLYLGPHALLVGGTLLCIANQTRYTVHCIARWLADESQTCVVLRPAFFGGQLEHALVAVHYEDLQDEEMWLNLGIAG